MSVGPVDFHSNRSCRPGAGTPWYEKLEYGLVRRIGTADSATPHPDPSGGQAPRLAKSSTALHWLPRGRRRMRLVADCAGPSPAPAGDKPPHYIFSFRPRTSVYKSAGFAGGEPASGLIGGRGFVPIAHAG